MDSSTLCTVTVGDLAVRTANGDDIERLKSLLAEHGVVILPGQDVGDDIFLSFLRKFGQLVFATGETPVPEYPDLNVVSNVGRTRPPRSVFHVDTSYLRRPPVYTALRAVAIPAEGGATLFADQYHAYETLPAALRRRLEGRTLTHVVTRLELSDEDETSAEHPIFVRHPISGRTAVYLSTPQRCVAVSGMTAAESADVVHALYAHCTRAENTVEHNWSAGDIVIWDNRCVLHRGDHGGVVGDRVMHRGMVVADAPLEAAGSGDV